MHPRPVLVLIPIVALLAVSPRAAELGDGRRTLSFDERVEYQRRIEEVYWRHRTWPRENAAPKPRLAEVLPEEVLRASVADAMRKSEALEAYWQRPLTGAQLQAEMNRMARSTRSPEVLHELFAALDHDPFLIAECLVRPILGDRLVRRAYAFDDRFHGAIRKVAEEALERQGAPAGLSDLGDRYEEQVWVLTDGGKTEERSANGERTVIELSSEQWEAWLSRLERRFRSRGGSAGVARDPDRISTACERLPVGKLSPLQESESGFFAQIVLDKSASSVRVATVIWDKTSFETWLHERFDTTAAVEGPAAGTATGASGAVKPPESGYFEPEGWGAEACNLDDTWREIPILEGRDGHTAVWTGTEMIVWGGFGDTGMVLLDTGRRYDPSTDTWQPTSRDANTPSGRLRHTAVWTGTEMIVWGGQTPQGQTDTGGRYDPATDTWLPTSTGANVPSGREQHTAAWTGTEMIVWGGMGGGDLNTGGRYDPSSDTWAPTATGANVPAARWGHTAVWTGAEMIVWGGVGQGQLNTGGRYDPSSDTWLTTSTGADVPSPRESHTAVWTGSEMVVWGGTGDPWGTGGRYDPATDTWQPTSADGAPSARDDHTAVWTGTEMIVWGGNGDPNGTGGRYDPATDTWQPTSTDGAPSSRSSHTAVWTGSEMIVWGGRGTSSNFNLDTGGRYDPVTDSWQPTSTDPEEPLPRSRFTVVWTGSEMVVWGGDENKQSNAGGRYDPATDTWRPTSTGPGTPDWRDDHTAVWTGTEMIVWGGHDALPPDGLANSGGRYDPTSDTWQPTSTGANVPAPRVDHTAVWTGTEMVVWGGRDYTIGYFDTGGRYDPAADTWQPTRIDARTPSPRAWHTAVWTGAEMIVWGGAGSAGGLDVGGRYDPAANRWEETSAVGAPSQRSSHTVVWTGTEMIVWGGSDNSGGRYDPAGDSWQPTSTVGAPSGYEQATAVWTGTEMIVWGGQSAGFFFDTGGRYDPSTDSWQPTSTTEAPSPRQGHGAVWADPGMLVWGGEGNGYRLNSGGVYYACVATTWYRDGDGDGLGDSAVTQECCTRPAGYVAVAGDCDDANPHCDTDCADGDGDTYCVTLDCDDAQSSIHPGAPQICGDGWNNDCDHPSWPSLVGTNEYDDDGDGLTECNGDCDDGNPHCDTDCTDGDGDTYCVTTDCDDTNARCDSDCTDGDGDTYCVTTDCDDGQSSVHPGAPQVCGDGRNNDCDHPSWPSLAGTNEYDDDGDTLAECDGDCDDADPAVYPGAVQTCDGVNNDCNHPSWPGLAATNEYDDDVDTFTECAGDCDDDNPAVYPGAAQVCDGVNNDCNHPSWPGLAATNEYDDDVDTFTECAGDCDDSNSTVYPEAAQACDGVNNDCDHPSWPSLVGTNEYDDDLDTLTECAGDCNDGDPTVYPGAPQLCDGKNNDCFDLLYPTPPPDEANDDGDPFRICEGDCDDSNSTVYPGAAQLCFDGLNNDCTHPEWPFLIATNEYDDDGDLRTECAGDCDDGNASIYPGAAQVCDGVNNDCDHPSWPSLVGTNEYDDDGDLRTECAGDCDDGNGTVWATPGEVRDLRFASRDVLGWTGPLAPGGTVTVYDTLRSDVPGDFLSAGVCVETDDGTDTSATDVTTPGPGQADFYLVRAENACPVGRGSLGRDSAGHERDGTNCP